MRNLEREIATVCRKVARICLQANDDALSIIIDEKLVSDFLGPSRYRHEIAEQGHRLGVTTGLVWTEFGGEIISVEATMMRGSQQLILTGSLGSVIRESAQTALSFIRSHAPEFSLDQDFFNGNDIHIHIPAGGVPKTALPPALPSRWHSCHSFSKTGPKGCRFIRRPHPLRSSPSSQRNRGKSPGARKERLRKIIFPEANKINIEGCSTSVVGKESSFWWPAISFQSWIRYCTQDTGTRMVGSSNSD